MTRVIAALSEIAADYDAVFCDLWGCLHNGIAAFPAAVAALDAFRAQGGHVLLLTNAPRPRAAVLRQLAALGVPAGVYDDIVTSGDAAQAALFAGLVGRAVYHLGPEKDRSFFTEITEPDLATEIALVPLEEAEGVVCTGLFDDLTETAQNYRATLLQAKTRGLKLLCANPDIVVDLGERQIFCAGAIAALYTEMGGESLYFGKPYPPIYDLARRRLASLAPDAERILCIGDGFATDIAGGVAEGLDTLFVTGGIDAAAFGPDPDAPDAALLAAWLAQKQVAPTAAIGKLR